MTPPRTVEEIAAQIWCEPQHAHKTMDVELCKSFAQALAQVREAALEEAAKIAEDIYRVDVFGEEPGIWARGGRIAKAIRALKGRP